MLARGELDIEADISSDTAPLNGLVSTLLGACTGVRALRDATRGGVATILNETATAADVGVLVRELTHVRRSGALSVLATVRHSRSPRGPERCVTATWRPQASLQLGNLLADQGDAEGARAAYQWAIDRGLAGWRLFRGSCSARSLSATCVRLVSRRIQALLRAAGSFGPPCLRTRRNPRRRQSRRNRCR
jgi:hypothetical protein